MIQSVAADPEAGPGPGPRWYHRVALGRCQVPSIWHAYREPAGPVPGHNSDYQQIAEINPSELAVLFNITLFTRGLNGMKDGE